MESQEQRIISQAVIERLDILIQLQTNSNKLMEILAGDVMEELEQMNEEEPDSEQEVEDRDEEEIEDNEEMNIKPSINLNKENGP